MPGSRRYSDPAAYLLTSAKWAGQRVEFCRLVGKPYDAAAGLARVEKELHTALGELEQTLAAGDGLVRLDEGGDLVISPLSAEDVPAEAVALKAELTEMLPFAPIVSLLIEMDKRTGFLGCFTHAGGKQARSPELKRNLIAVLIAQSTNLGLTRMADACGISHDILAWTAEWYVREETLRAANLALIGYHGKLPLTAVFGSGTLSSSDGQRFPTRGKSVTARALSRYFAHEGLSTYTHVTDRHTTYGTKVIVATRREAHYMLDEILGNATDIPITEHATDTHGVTLANFALFDLLGLQLSPRIRDLGKITLYRTGPKAQVSAAFPLAGPLLARRANTALIAAHWDDLLRLAGSLKFGHATASLLVGKLSASGRQNALAAALKEYGALRRTIYAARYLSDAAYRRKISRQLNKGESLHALKRDLLYTHEGAVRARHLEQQTEQAWCLTLVTNPGYDLDDRVLRAGGGLDARGRPPHRRPGPGPHLTRAQREHQLLRLNRRRHRRRTRPARPHRLPASARPRHPVLTLGQLIGPGRARSAAAVASLVRTGAGCRSVASEIVSRCGRCWRVGEPP
ncbi:transposase [Actinomadura rudentiformis]|nr:transposase [Actinomadura rudentiformis]